MQPSATNEPLVEQDDLSEDVPETPTPAAPPVGMMVDPAALAAALAFSVNGPRKIGPAEYQRTRSLHRASLKGQLQRKYLQNGIQLFREQLTADAIAMLNELQPGLYADGFFNVVPVQDGNKLTGLDIRYSNKTIDDRMKVKSFWPTFEHMLAAMLKERAERQAA